MGVDSVGCAVVIVTPKRWINGVGDAVSLQLLAIAEKGDNPSYT